MTDYSQVLHIELFMMRSTDPVAIDAELDRRNQQAARKCKVGRRKPKWQMIDTHRESNRWYIEDDGTIRDIPA